MSTLGVVAEIPREIVDLVCGRLPTTSKIHETVVSYDLTVEMRDQVACSRFLRVGHGEFVLKEGPCKEVVPVNENFAGASSS